MSRVSVLVPICNTERYLRECMDSIVKQTLRDMEIICINDGSTDRSPDILREYAQRDARIRIIDKENSGYGASMNVGLDAAEGDYIGILESDDWAEPEMFATLLEKAVLNDAEVVKSSYYDMRNGRSFYAENLAGDPQEQIFSPLEDDPHMFFVFESIWSALYKKSFLRKHRIRFHETPGASYQDVSFSFRVNALAKRMYLIGDAFLHYRNDNPDSSVNSPQKLFCIFDEMAEVRRFLDAHPAVRRKFLRWLAPYVYRQYHAPYERAILKYKHAFLTRMRTELAAYDREGLIAAGDWPPALLERVQRILNDAEQYYRDSLMEKQRADLLRRGLQERLKEAGAFFIYGAGRVGKEVCRSVLKRGFTPRAMLVSDTAGNPAAVEGIPVGPLSGLSKPEERPLILIAVTERTQTEIIDELLQRGFENLIAMTAELRGAIR